MSKPGKSGATRPLMLVASSGGHLAQLLTTRPLWADRPRVWVTFGLPDAQARLDGETVVWAHHPTTRNIPNMLRNFVLAFRTLRRTRPQCVLSTGAGVAFPFFVVARLLAIPTIYVEVFDRFDSPTATGRLCAPFTTTFCVQTREALSLYPGATYIGSLL